MKIEKPGLIKFKNFDEAKKIVKSFNINTAKEWKKFCKSSKFPNYLPKAPDGTYKEKWKGWGDFLGTGNISTKNKGYNYLDRYLPYEEAKQIAKKEKIKKLVQWNKFVKSSKFPKNLPKAPQHLYKKEWKGWPDFLGKKK